MANRIYTVEKGSPRSFNSSGAGCGNSGQRCPSSSPDAFNAALSNSAMEEFTQGINAQSSPILLPIQGEDDSYSLPMPGARGTRVIKRTRVTRTSSDPDDPELQNNTLFDGPDQGQNSHGSSGPETYDTFQGFHTSSLKQQTIPPVHKKQNVKNYDDNISAPAQIRTDRAPCTPKSQCFFPPYPQQDSQASRSPFNNGNSYMMGSAAAAYGRSFDPARVIIDPRTDNQTAPGRMNASLMSRSVPFENQTVPFENQTVPPAFGRSFDPKRVFMDPRMDNQTAPGNINASLMSRSGYGPCVNQTRSPERSIDPRMNNQAASRARNASIPRSARGGYGNLTAPPDYDRSFDPEFYQTIQSTIDPSFTSSSGCNASRNQTAGPAFGRSIDRAPVIPFAAHEANQSAPGGIDASLLSRSSRGGCPDSCGSYSRSSAGSSGYYASSESSRRAGHPASKYASPRNTGQVPYSSPTANASYYPSEAPHSGQVSGNNQTPASAECSFNSPDYRTPARRPMMSKTLPSRVTNPNFSNISSGFPGAYVSQPLHRSLDKANASGLNRSQPLTRDYFTLIEDGNLTPTSKKKKIVRETTSTGSVVSEECEEIYDIPEAFGMTGVSATNEMESFNNKNFHPMYTSSPPGLQIPCLDKSGIDPMMSGMAHYIDRSSRRGNQSSTINESDFGPMDISGNRSMYQGSSTITDSDFNTMASSGSGSKKGPCCCKKKGGKKGSPKDQQSLEQVSKCEDLGSPCNEKKSHLSNRSDGGAIIVKSDDPVSVFQAGKYEMTTDASATHSVTPAADSKSCVCKGGNMSISLDLERIEQEEFNQLSRNLSQWHQSRRKVVANIDSLGDSKPDPGSCTANCSSK